MTHILVDSPTLFKELLSILRFWLENLDCEFLFIISFFSYSQMTQDMIVCGCHPLTQEVNENWYAFQNYNCNWCDTNEMIGKITLSLFIVSFHLIYFLKLFYGIYRNKTVYYILFYFVKLKIIPTYLIFLFGTHNVLFQLFFWFYDLCLVHQTNLLASIVFFVPKPFYIFWKLEQPIY